MQRIVAGIC